MSNRKKKTAPEDSGAVFSDVQSDRISAVLGDAAETLQEKDSDEVVKEEAVQESVSKMPDFDNVVVIPYKKNAAKGQELLYAVRAWEKHLPDVRIAVIGDSEDWFGKNIIHIPHKPVSTNPQVDVAHKMMTAIASKDVPEYFIWSNDDIYCLCDIHPADIHVLKAHGKLVQKGLPNGLYRNNSLRTVKALKDAGIADPYDYATHTPVYLEKEYLAEVIERFNCTKEGYLIYSLYANLGFPNVRPIITYNDTRGSIVASVYRPDPDRKILEHVIANRKWLNNNDSGWKAVEPYLKKLFPNKSKFEK